MLGLHPILRLPKQRQRLRAAFSFYFSMPKKKHPDGNQKGSGARPIFLTHNRNNQQDDDGDQAGTLHQRFRMTRMMRVTMIESATVTAMLRKIAMPGSMPLLVWTTRAWASVANSSNGRAGRRFFMNIWFTLVAVARRAYRFSACLEHICETSFTF